jgi:hypothetical protein
VPVYVTASLRLDLVEAASEANGCIDKFAVWIDASCTATFAPIFINIPFATSTVIPYFACDNGYIPSPGSVLPLSALGTLFSTISNSVTTNVSRYATVNGLVGGSVVECWFHRQSGVDISSAAFNSEWGNVIPSGKYLFHFDQSTGFNVQFKTSYQSGFDGLGGALYQEGQTLAYELLAADCSGGGGETGTGWAQTTADCPTWTPQAVECPSWSAQAVDCPTWTKADEPI